MKIIFATTNKHKLAEAEKILEMDIEGTPLDIEEIQSLDPEKVAIEKAKAYYKVLSKPILIEDVSLSFKALNGLPGTYIKDFEEALGREGLIELLNNKEDRSAVAQATLVYYNGEPNIFTGKVFGTVPKSVRGDSGFGWDPLFIPDGEDRTFAEMSEEEKAKYSHRAKALHKFKDWLAENQLSNANENISNVSLAKNLTKTDDLDERAY